MTDNPLMRRILWTSAAVCLVAAVLAAAIVAGGDDSDDGDGSDLAATGGTTTSALAGDGGDPGGGGGGQSETSVAPGTPTTAARGSSSSGGSSGGSRTQSQSPTTTAAGGGGGGGSTSTQSSFKDLGAVDNAGGVSMPAQGVYQYTYKSDEGSQDATTKVEHKGPAPGGGQSMVLSVSGRGFDSVNDITWGPNEVRVLKSTFQFGTSRAECDWNPDYLEMQLALAKGTQWQADSSCMISGVAPQPVPVTRRTSVKVTDARRVQIGGTETTVWVMESTEHTEAAGTVSDRTYTDWFSPKHGVTVRQAGKVKATGARGGSGEQSYELEIKSLQPT